MRFALTVRNPGSPDCVPCSGECSVPDFNGNSYLTIDIQVYNLRMQYKQSGSELLLKQIKINLQDVLK